MSNTARLLTLGILVLCGGCTATIIPPPTQGRDVVPVQVADYGYHSTIVIPKSSGRGLIEYAYGDWEFFGQNQKSLSTGVHALFASDQATLGRRTLDRPPDQPGLREALGAKAVLRFDAPRDKVAALERELEKRFSVRLDTIQYSPVHHLYFVKDDEPYGLTHNCNHFTAEWLERLGCRVEGFRMASNFRLNEPERSAAPPPPASPEPAPRTAETAVGQLRSIRPADGPHTPRAGLRPPHEQPAETANH